MDFTQGSIIKKIALFAIPIVLAEMLQNLYNTVDSMVVGNFVGDKALAAVSVCSAISQLVVGFFNGMSIGSSVLAGRYFGGGDSERLSAAMRNTFAFSVVFGAALSAAGIFLTPWLINLISVPQEVYGDAVVYLRIYLAGMLFTVIYNVAAGLLRAVGDSRSPLNILVMVCVLNIGLDLLFVRVMRLGVAGVSIATVISQCVSVVVAYFRLKGHDPEFCLTFRELPREKKIIANMIGIGMPAGMQNSLISFSNLFVWRYISGFDAASMAGVGAAQRIDRFVAMPSKAYGLALTTYVSQNVGARKPERIGRGVRDCLLLSLATCAAASVLLYFGAERCVKLFNDAPGVVKVGVDMMRVLLPCYSFLAVREVWLGVLRGYGDTKIPLLLSLTGMIVLRQLYLAIALSLDHSIVHIYIGYPLAWGATALMTGIYYLMKRKKYERMLTEPAGK